MMRKILKSSAVLVVVVVIFAAMMAWSAERKAIVHSEPLPCVSQGDIVICFDGIPGPTMICERLDSKTVLCTT